MTLDSFGRDSRRLYVIQRIVITENTCNYIDRAIRFIPCLMAAVMGKWTICRRFQFAKASCGGFLEAPDCSIVLIFSGFQVVCNVRNVIFDKFLYSDFLNKATNCLSLILSILLPSTSTLNLTTSLLKTTKCLACVWKTFDVHLWRLALLP